MTDETRKALVELIYRLALHVRPTCSELYAEAMQAIAIPPDDGCQPIADAAYQLRMLAADLALLRPDDSLSPQGRRDYAAEIYRISQMLQPWPPTPTPPAQAEPKEK